MDPATKKLDVPWNAAHFGAWCTVSSPLTLGLNLLSPELEEVIPIITNKEAIAVNQNWAGHPGFLVATYDASAKADKDGFIIYANGGALTRGNDLAVKNMSSLDAAEAWCKGQADCVGFTTDVAKPNNNKVYFKEVAVGINTDKNWTSYVKKQFAPAGTGTQQIWAKPQPNGAFAVIYINGGGAAGKSPFSEPLDLVKDLGIKKSAKVVVRDIWAKKDVSTISGSDPFTPPTPVAPRASGFYLLSPQEAL